MKKTSDITAVTIRDYKPVAHIEKLIKALSPYVTYVSASKGQRFNYVKNGQPMCYLFDEGNVTVHDIHDGRVLSTAFGPAVLGISNYIITQEMAYITANQSMQLGIISVKDLARELEANDLWHPFSHLLLFTISHFIQLTSTQVKPTSYERIRMQILALNDESDEVKRKTNITHYIQERTLLSRSHVMMIISELKKGGNIEVVKGVLIKVNSLPQKF